MTRKFVKRSKFSAGFANFQQFEATMQQEACHAANMWDAVDPTVCWLKLRPAGACCRHLVLWALHDLVGVKGIKWPVLQCHHKQRLRCYGQGFSSRGVVSIRRVFYRRWGVSYIKIGTIQRRLAWPLRKDDTQIRV